MTKRLFIAIEIPNNVKNNLVSVQENLKKIFGTKGATYSGSMHLTLKFLGNTEESLINRISSSCENSLFGFGKFNLSVTAINCFPNYNYPKTVMANLAPLEQITKLSKVINFALQNIGIEVDKRPFKPHITIFRPKKQFKINPDNYQIEREMTVKSVKIYESILKPDRAYYNVIKEIEI